MDLQKMRKRLFTVLFLLLGLPMMFVDVMADAADTTDRYLVQPGDVLMVSVWKEQDLQTEVLVQPDGGLSFPLAGELMAAGKSVAEVRAEIATRLEHYIPKPVVTVAVRTIGGNRVYVLGKVARPGEYPFSKPVDVMLKRAGGATYLFATEMRSGNTTGTFTLRDFPAKATAEVIGENRNVTVTNGVFKDDFSSYGVHLYKITQ